jgi:hypothetical protein
MTRATGMVMAVVAVVAGAGAAAAQTPNKVPVVAVVGCLSQDGAAWRLTTATDPVPSIANGPPAGEAIKGPTAGKNEFRLIGVSEFDLPAHRGHTVLVKGLLVKAEPVSRVNVTSVTMVSNACAAAAK